LVKTIFRREIPLQVGFYTFSKVVNFIRTFDVDFVIFNLVRTTGYLNYFPKHKIILDLVDSIGLNYLKSKMNNFADNFEFEKAQEFKEKIEEFIYNYSDGLLLVKEISDKDKFIQANYIILVEGKGDKECINKYLEIYKKKEYYVETANDGANKVEALLKTFACKEYKQNELQNKKFILLYDFDYEGYNKGLVTLIPGSDKNFFLARSVDKNLKDFRYDTIKNENIIGMMHYPIEENEFNKEKNNKDKIKYNYKNNINDVIYNNYLKFEIEDLIVAYNVDKYKKFLSDQNQKPLTIENFFSLKRGKGKENPCHKKTVKSFFKEKHEDEDFNFAGFNELFKRIEANFTPASKNSQGVDDEK
jgi:5S rRNA maturation endonuclease (ribonuclease M5)